MTDALMHHTEIADHAKAEAARLYALVPWKGEDGETPKCPHCGATIYPKETAEYRAWGAAQDALNAAALAAYFGGEISLNDALLRWELTQSTFKLAVAHEAARRARLVQAGINWR